jgi:hypothetical protein
MGRNLPREPVGPFLLVIGAFCCSVVGAALLPEVGKDLVYEDP